MDTEDMDMLKIQIPQKELEILVQKQAYAERYGKVPIAKKDMTSSIVHSQDTSDAQDLDMLKFQIAEKELEILLQKQAYAERHGKVLGAKKDMTPSIVHLQDTSDYQSNVTKKGGKQGHTLGTQKVMVFKVVEKEKLEGEQHKGLQWKRLEGIAAPKNMAEHGQCKFLVEKTKTMEKSPCHTSREMGMIEREVDREELEREQEKGLKRKIREGFEMAENKAKHGLGNFLIKKTKETMENSPCHRTQEMRMFERERLQDIEICEKNKEVSHRKKIENTEVVNMEVIEQERAENMEVCDEGQKQYVVDVDNEGIPIGPFRKEWLAYIRACSQHINFTVEKYESHDKSMLLKVKQDADDRFEYRGGLGKVPEQVFHSELLVQLQRRRKYFAMKTLLEGKKKP